MEIDEIASKKEVIKKEEASPLHSYMQNRTLSALTDMKSIKRKRYIQKTKVPIETEGEESASENEDEEEGESTVGLYNLDDKMEVKDQTPDPDFVKNWQKEMARDIREQQQKSGWQPKKMTILSQLSEKEKEQIVGGAHLGYLGVGKWNPIIGDEENNGHGVVETNCYYWWQVLINGKFLDAKNDEITTLPDLVRAINGVVTVQDAGGDLNFYEFDQSVNQPPEIKLHKYYAEQYNLMNQFDESKNQLQNTLYSFFILYAPFLVNASDMSRTVENILWNIYDKIASRKSQVKYKNADIVVRLTALEKAHEYNLNGNQLTDFLKHLVAALNSDRLINYKLELQPKELAKISEGIEMFNLMILLCYFALGINYYVVEPRESAATLIHRAPVLDAICAQMSNDNHLVLLLNSQNRLKNQPRNESRIFGLYLF